MDEIARIKVKTSCLTGGFVDGAGVKLSPEHTLRNAESYFKACARAAFDSFAVDLIGEDWRDYGGVMDLPLRVFVTDGDT